MKKRLTLGATVLAAVALLIVVATAGGPTSTAKIAREDVCPRAAAAMPATATCVPARCPATGRCPYASAAARRGRCPFAGRAGGDVCPHATSAAAKPAVADEAAGGCCGSGAAKSTAAADRRTAELQPTADKTNG